MIGHECASKIKDFLSGATLDSLVSVNVSNCSNEYLIIVTLAVG